MILVTGATGNIGHALIDILVERGQQVRAIVPQLAAGETTGFQPPNIQQNKTLPATVDIVAGNLQHPLEMVHAFAGVDSIFINPRAVGLAITDLLKLAKAQGVRRVVTLSASNIHEDVTRQPSRYNGDRNLEVEQAVVASGLEWTALRSTYYAINTVGMWAPQIKRGNTVYGPYANWENSPLDEIDVAEAAAQALLTDVALNQHPIIAGPESLTQTEMVQIIGDIIGRPLIYTELSPKDARQAMVHTGFSGAFTDAFLNLMATDAGKPAQLSGDLERILGRKPHTYREWVTRHRADFIE